MINCILFIYGLLMIGGGYMGYKKANSKMSLIMGIASGLFVLLGLLISKSNPSLGYGIITATSGLLCVVFAKRYLVTKSFMPSGMLFTLSLLALFLSFFQI